jgi:amino acid permease
MKLMGERLSSKLTVVGMVNGMIGGLILILPVLTLDAGWALSLAVLLVIGGLSFYSCYLCVIHMGDQPDLDWAIYRHFNGSKLVKTVYDLCVWSNLILIDMLYFELIVIQWQGLLPSDHITLLNPFLNAAWLLLIVLLLKFF